MENEKIRHEKERLNKKEIINEKDIRHPDK
jgi:hypothetical protein